MKCLLYSDVHGNLPAFEKLLKEVGDCDLYICLGDLVNYGPWSNECVDLALSLKNSVIIKGNHEDAFINGAYPGNNQLVVKFFNKCFPGFKKKVEISNFISHYDLNGFRFAHTFNEMYVYPDTEIILDHNYVIGHSHHQFVTNNNMFVLYNTGSVGQNRKYINKADFIILDTAKMHFHLESVIYDLDLVINEMKSKKYDSECIEYYTKKALA